jgi:hypothetical protein
MPSSRSAGSPSLRRIPVVLAKDSNVRRPFLPAALIAEDKPSYTLLVREGTRRDEAKPSKSLPTAANQEPTPADKPGCTPYGRTLDKQSWG